MRSSSAITKLASSTSDCSSASSARPSVSQTMSSPSSACCSSCWRTSWKCCRVWVIGVLAELSGDVLLGALVVGRREDLLRRRVLDQLPGEQERRGVGNARRLLHVVRDDHDRVALLELVD